VIDGEALARDMAAAAERFATPTRAVVLAEAARDAAFLEARRRGARVLVTPALDGIEAVFRGRNGRFVGNVLLWYYLWVPSFWVPDETFALEGTARLRFHAVESERLLYERAVPIDVEWPLDDFERGWSFLGLFTAPGSLEEEDWARVSDALGGHLRAALARALALEAAEALPAYLASEAARAREAAVHALAVGVSRHASGVAGAEGAPADARALAALVREVGLVPEKNTALLVDAAATAGAIDAALLEIAGRARPQDQVVLLWSGRGAAPPEGPRLLPFDADATAIARTGVSLERLRALLGKAAARRVTVVLDAAFLGSREGGRGLPAKGPAAGEAAIEAALVSLSAGFDGKDVTVIVPGGPSDDAIALEGTGRGLLSTLLDEGARGAADEDGDAVVTLGELALWLGREVPAATGLEGRAARPRIYRAGRILAERDPEMREPWIMRGDAPAPAGTSRAGSGRGGRG